MKEKDQPKDEKLTEYKILEELEKIDDPRVVRCKKHSLSSIIFIAVSASICGADNWVDTEEFGKGARSWLEKYIDLSSGVPSHDTFGRVFSLIKPRVFLGFFSRWTEFVREIKKGDVIAFDGKTLCGSRDEALGLKALHIVNAWSTSNGLCIGHLKVDDKTNEIKAIPELIELLDINGCIATADALNTQKVVAEKIIDAGADYILPVKGNHPTLMNDIEFYFRDALKSDFDGIAYDFYKTEEKSRNRLETRNHYVVGSDWLNGGKDWKGLNGIGMVIRKRNIKGNEAMEVAYYLMSTAPRAEVLAHASRSHWGVENGLHWKLDVVFKEDSNRYRNRIGAENMSLLRKLTANMLSLDKKTKTGLKAKRLKSAINVEYRESVVFNLKL
jgi:predicted transposase YbfD/YdcC